MRYYLIAGEPSGDLHGANLMKGLKAHDPEAKFRFWGGDKMAGVGGSGNLAKHYKETSFFGIVEVIKNLRTIRRQMKECRQDVEAFAPDVLILVDYPGFNMKMARWAKEHGIRVFYYIAPKVWAWREWRVKAIRKYVDELFIIFPFERDYFPKHGIRPICEGNPLVDAIEARRASLPSPDEFRRRHALDERPIVALLAGSRRSEIKANLPLMADLARKFPDRQFVVTGVSWLDRSIYEQYIADSGIRYVCDQTYECTGSGSLSHALVPGEIAALRAESSLRVAGEPQPGPRIGRGDHPVRPGHHTGRTGVAGHPYGRRKTGADAPGLRRTASRNRGSRRQRPLRGPDGGAAEKTGAVRCANCSRHTRRNSSAEGCWSCSAFWFGFSRT